MKTHFPFSAMSNTIQRTIALLLFTALLSFSKNSEACQASFVDSTYGSTAVFINTSQASNSAYWNWTFGDGTSSDLKNPTHQYNSFGPYLVCLTVYDTANNCTDTHCDSVYLGNIFGGCLADFTYATTGLTVDFTNLSTGNYTSVIWSFGDNTISYFNNPSHTYATGGLYYVCVTVSDTGANCNSTACQYVYVNDSAQACYSSFSYTATGLTLQFTNTSMVCNTADWFWNFGDGTYSTNFDPSHQYASAGYYTVCLAMFDSSCGCSDSTCSVVYAGGNNFFCTAAFALYPDSFQQGLYWGYNYSTGNNLTFTWTWGDGTSSTGQYPTHFYTDSGYYTICLTILDTISQCTDTYCSNYYILKTSETRGIHEVIFVNTTGIPSVNGTHEIEWGIFPNPASNNIRIQTNAEKIDAVRITDVSGKAVKEISSYTNESISLQSLPQGVYIVRAMIDGVWSSKLLIRQ